MSSRSHAQVRVFQTRIFPLATLEAIWLPSRLKASVSTGVLCPRSVPVAVPSAAFQIVISACLHAVASRSPSWLKATRFTAALFER